MSTREHGRECEAFADARARGFIRDDGERFWLADNERGEAGTPGYARTYGPAIAFCSFCAADLAPTRPSGS